MEKIVSAQQGFVRISRTVSLSKYWRENQCRSQPKHPGAANLMAHLCKELDIARFINHMVTWDDRQWKVSPGTLITALVINILVHRRPLYRVERFYEAMDMPLLF